VKVDVDWAVGKRMVNNEYVAKKDNKYLREKIRRLMMGRSGRMSKNGNFD
jgi:hypothetical protein